MVSIIVYLHDEKFAISEWTKRSFLDFWKAPIWNDALKLVAIEIPRLIYSLSLIDSYLSLLVSNRYLSFQSRRRNGRERPGD